MNETNEKSEIGRRALILRWVKRFVIYCIGLFIMAMGVVFSVKSALGVSPVTCLANVVYQIFGAEGITAVGLGVCTTAVYCLYILVELIILRKQFEAKMLLQIVASFFFGFLVDCATALFAFIPAPETYIMRLLCLLCSVPLVALGVMFYLAPQILPTPGEGMSLAISKRTGLTVSSSKVIFDCSMVVISAVTSLVYFHGFVGVREGTIICALTVGFVMKLFQKAFEKPIMRFVERDTEMQKALSYVSPVPVDATGKPKILISVSWEFGSGGYEIAKALADRLGIKFYGNDELIPMEAQESGLSESFIHQHEHTMSNGVVYNFLNSNYAMNRQLSPVDQLFAAQVRIFRQMAAGDESALIVGRCSDYILYEDPSSFRVFIHAPTDERVRRVATNNDISPEAAASELSSTDAARARHYQHFTGRQWGDTRYYNLAVDTDMFGLTGSLDLIEDAIRCWCEARGQEYQDIAAPIQAK